MDNPKEPKIGDQDRAYWFAAQEIIRQELDNEQAYGIWIAPIEFVSFVEGNLKLSVPNRFFKGWLVDRYAGIIESCAKRAFGCDLKIDLVFTPLEKPVGSLTGFTESDPQPHQGVPRTDEKAKDAVKAFWPFSRQHQPPPKEIGLKEKYTFDSFVIGPSNRFAHAASIAVSESLARAYNPLFIYGGVGLGKTHLMHAIGQRVSQKSPKAKILYITSEEFTNQLISAIQNRTTVKFREKYRNVDLLLIDDIHFIAGKESTQEEFFHTFNTLYDAHKQIVVSSDRPPKEIQALEERLVSRFEWGLVTDIQPPDLETRIAILKKKSEKETITLPEDVFYFLGEKVRTNIRELEGALIRVVAYAKLMGKEVSVDLVKEVLHDMIAEGEKKVTIDLIQKKVSEYFDIKLTDMRSKRRSKAIAYPRQVAMYIARQFTDFSLPEIGEHFGGRDHTTVIHACDKIESDLKVKAGLRESLDRITRSFKA